MEPYDNVDQHLSTLEPKPIILTARLGWMLYYDSCHSVSDTADKFNISKKTIYKWLKRYKAGESMVERSRRPHTNPRQTPSEIANLIREQHKETGFGQRRLKRWMQDQYNVNLCERTIWKICNRVRPNENV